MRVDGEWDIYFDLRATNEKTKVLMFKNQPTATDSSIFNNRDFRGGVNLVNKGYPSKHSGTSVCRNPM